MLMVFVDDADGLMICRDSADDVDVLVGVFLTVTPGTMYCKALF